jgi:hypothetical protein
MMMTILILLLIGASSMVVQILFVIFAIVELKLWKHEVAVMLLFGWSVSYFGSRRVGV